MTTMWHLLPLLLALTSSFVDAQYYGERVGDLSQNAHDVSGTVYIVDSTRIRIRNFNYDGTGPDAFFWIGDGTDEPSEQGYISPNEMGRNDVLGMYQNADIILTLPDGWTVSRLKWLSVWCRRFTVDFGSIQFPGQSSCVPAATDIGMFTGYAHDVASGSVHVLDAKTIKIEGFYYDGLGPDAYFYVGTGDVSVANGYRVPVGLDTTTATILEMYENATIQLRLPGDITVQDITWISVYCVSASTNFGDIQVSADLCVPPYTGAPMYFGEVIGALSTMAYEVSGLVHVVDSKRLFIQGFSYTGQGPDAYFYVGLEGQHGPAPAAGGIIVPNEMGSNEKLGRYDDVDVVLSMPGAITTDQIIWFSVWCEDVGVDFGSVVFPENFLVPAQVSIGPFVQTAHAVSSGDVTIVDKRTLRIPAFSYDGLAPDTFFIVGSGTPSSFGIKVPNELGSMAKLERYDNKDITLVLPSGLDVDRIDYISVYCVSASESFGQIMFPDPPINVPPFLPGAPLGLLPYCKAMSENFNVAWDVTDTHIIFEYTGNIGTTNGYMAFGVSGSESRSAMIGADPAIVYLDNGSPTVEDFTINEYSLCAGGRGVCRDTNQDINGNNNVEILDMRLVEGVTRVRFQRPLAAADAETDKTISTDSDMFVVWAVGEVNSFGQVTKHPERLIGNMQINFGSPAASDCQEIQGIPPPEVEPWPMLTLSGEDNKVFYAKIGLSGGKKGYGGITGNTPWGIAWYINGILIPEITVKRGETFTFYVEGGDDTSNNAQYHPFYITDDAQGGYFTKSEEERQNIALYAGTTENNGVVMGTDGRYCEYKGNANPEDFDTFEAYNATLTLECAEGDAGMFTWTPDENTPDLVYYQCFTHNFLGWKIHVVDEYELSVNCESLDEDFNVQWTVDGSDITFEFTGAIDLDNGYMAFGLSGSDERSSFMLSDVMVVSMNMGTPQVMSYFVTDLRPCDSGLGVCHDEATSADIEVLGASVSNGITRVTFKRPLAGARKTIGLEGNMYIVWSLGKLNLLNEPLLVKSKGVEGNMMINFGSRDGDNCEPVRRGASQRVNPWMASRITALEDAAFEVRMGPDGGEKGYEAITGKVSRGVAWYINGTLLPELTVQRGKNYTFTVYSGNDPTMPLEYFPFYITSDPVGGYMMATATEREDITIFAGTQQRNGILQGTVGHFCDYMTDTDPMDYSNFESWTTTFIETPCEGVAGKFVWTPDEQTPDVVYYQAFNYNYLGWKINVQSEQQDTRASLLDQEHVETAMFILVAICFVFVLATIMLCLNYSSVKSALKKAQAENAKTV